MFAELSEKLSARLKLLAGGSVLTERDVTDGLLEIRRVVLEADVSFQVSREFIERIRDKAIGLTRIKAVSPGQQRRLRRIVNGSRRLRIAKGSGRPVSEINRLLKTFRQMRTMMNYPNVEDVASERIMP